MWKLSSSSRIVSAFLKLHFNRLQVNPFHQIPSNSAESALSHFPFRCRTNPFSNLYIPIPNPISPSGFRFFSFKPSNSASKFNTHFAKNVFQNPTGVFTTTLSKHREAIALHFDAFFKRNYLFLFGVGGVFLCALLWRIMFGIANTFVGLSEGMAKYGFLALSTAIVSFAGLYVRSRLTINPGRVYRIAMRMLNTSPEILEVLGAPLTGTDLRAYVMSGGGITLKNLKPKFRRKRCFLIFPIQGSERKGLVSVEVKNNKGEGLTGFTLMRAVGNAILMIFEDNASLRSVKNDKSKILAEWFSIVEAWSESLVMECRRVWLVCEGVPFHAWNWNTFKNIADKWGLLLAIDESCQSPSFFDRAKIQVLTKADARIDSMVELKVGDNFFKVMVHEIEPSFKPNSWAPEEYKSH
ncbi:hypothetical protein F3Y22_tig00110270pilonHSYRG00035 [Hibiscus syriacus]|uniref:Uncharacterized protein n=1 Tax=Hibiscus syriacus TaxID=106335 RepID=A0A6A3B5U8_HIBSY|nr:hypothetical protein F3Y22_tig00110270pilonHSYRG00035 [Hibiscus syriacus]